MTAVAGNTDEDLARDRLDQAAARVEEIWIPLDLERLRRPLAAWLRAAATHPGGVDPAALGMADAVLGPRGR